MPAQIPLNLDPTGSDIDSGAHPLDAILDRWRREGADAPFNRTRDMGDAFEELCAAFLTHDPVQALDVEDVTSFSAWAEARGIVQADTGVDLVAKLRNKPGYAAIQCKFHAAGTTVARAEIDSFLAASGRSEFSRRILIDTTGRRWSTTLENTLRHQPIPVQRIGLHDLKASPIDWSEYVSSGGTIVRAPPKTARKHQQQAIDSAVAHFAEPDTRGKLLMACGTGKTLAGLRIAETTAGHGGRILVLVPSLALLSQTLRAWLDDATTEIRAFAVCSDAQTGRPRRRKDDSADMDPLDLVYPATTSAARLAEHAAPDAPDRMTVVFATYQSSAVLEAAQRDHGLPAFDLAIADEAHRTAGALIPGEDLSPFVRIHDNDAIQAHHRLYMTATPKVYAASARKRAGNLATTLCSMEDEKTYGPVLHETRFGEAVDQGLLADYRVIVLTVPEALAANVTIRDFADGQSLTVDEQGRMIGCLRALAKTDKDQFPADDQAPMRRAIAFCNFIESSKQLERRIGDVAAGYAEFTDDHDAPPVRARHVDGTFNASARADALAFLDETPHNETRILTNARCLTEGVDVPALDGILFMHPRKSQIEVVQAVGRVMRQSPGKQLGYVILPVVVPSSATPEQALDNDARWKSVWQMLNAIRSHDERFEGMLNRMAFGEPGERISIITFSDWQPPGMPGGKDGPAPDPHVNGTDIPPIQHQMVFEGLPEAIRTKIVEKCGNRRYWEDWAGDVATIASAHIERIRSIVESGEAEREIFREFLTELRDDLNPDVSEADAIEMLAQHMVTKPVFDALFGEAAASRRNTVSQGMQTVLDVLEPAGLDREAANLDAFYESVRRRVEGAATAEARQQIVVELYDKFFRNAFPRMTARLGIVYTPVEIVDFILRSVQHVLREEFAAALGDPDVHVLDPFTGTGTFITRLIQSGMLSKDEIVRKYGGNGRAPELHANEIVLLAYYIASVNIETAFQGVTGAEYRPFDGICLTDTFAMHDGEDLIASIFPHNSSRRERQKNLDIRVIVGNPPWSAKQARASDDNPNLSYPPLVARIAETYADRATTTNKNSLYNPYKMAIRWASDRIQKDGIAAYVTSASWIDGNMDAGVRACLAEEFTSIYVVNLRGNQRTQGEKSRQEGGKVFGQGSREPVAITLLVRKAHNEQQECRILYRSVDDYLTREEKLSFLDDAQSIANISNWQTIHPDRHFDWIGHRNEAFQRLYVIGSKATKAGRANDSIFRLYSNGYKTGRDPYFYNFGREESANHARTTIHSYLEALKKWGLNDHESSTFDDIVSQYSSLVRWDDELKSRLRRRRSTSFDRANVWNTHYRPFVKQYCYVDYLFASRKYRLDSIFPTSHIRNQTICVPGIGSTTPFSTLMVDVMPDINIKPAGVQCFPRYRYVRPPNGEASLFDDSPPLGRIDNITDNALSNFREHYGDATITKDAIFDYVYGVLHASDYRERFANDLAKDLPRVPKAPDFHSFAAAGQALAWLHLEYETCAEYPLTTELKSEDQQPEHFRIGTRAMRYANDAKTTLIVNDHVRLSGIPAEAHRYAVNGRTPLGWFIDRYRITTDTHSGIVNDPNGWFDDPRDFIAAVRRIVHMSVETVRIVESLPPSLDA